MIADHYLKKVGERIGRVSHASSLAAAHASLEAEGADLVLLDLTLPDSKMEATLAALGSLTRSYRDTSFVALSSLGSQDIALSALEHGAAAFLPKQEINVASLNALLDDLDVARPAPSSAADPDVVNAAPDQSEIDARRLASKIAHDALGWASNIRFRASAMAADPSVQASDALRSSVESIRSSALALTSFISGARSLLITELEALTAAPGDTEELDLGPWLTETAERWQKSTRNKRLAPRIDVRSSGRVPDEVGRRLLSRAVTALLQNAAQHAARPEGPIAFHIHEVPSDGPRVVLDAYDDGGPWSIDDAEALGTPLTTGQKKAASAGLGLYSARRALEALGGSMTFHERASASGSYLIRLQIPRA
ncbi:Response regulator receiver domain protein [Planctomycetes bacterium Poly30]|uniref:histidine kinase n=1 Tax=Saltatorellus ferox TaxID=2528018 RepID=A0A518F0M5_9BACT|nr:Response regulator receiver domain protein [Planctomycetes bacterium Poly30]